ncbi:hypothetical protein EsH8_IX_000429 [Colletotrichum jinshuiense]
MSAPETPVNHAFSGPDQPPNASPVATSDSEDTGYDSEATDLDSTLGADAHPPSTVSLRSTILRYRRENGRTYHAYKDGAYFFPNDELEMDRLDLQHNLFRLTLDNRLHLSPLSKENPPQRVLDIGTGTGIWAIDFADEHPQSHVVGVDLSPIQPSYVPPNAHFHIEDIEDEPWSFSQRFDFVFCRMNTAGIRDFPKLFRQSYENMNPGGWIEATDIMPVTCDDGTLGEDTALYRWSRMALDGAREMGSSYGGAKDYKRQMRDAGFVNVEEVVFKWPQNRWAKHPWHKELGTWAHENITMGLEGISLGVFTRALGWSKENVDVLLAEVRNDMNNTAIHAYWPIYVVYGQKPQT